MSDVTVVVTQTPPAEITVSTTPPIQVTVSAAPAPTQVTVSTSGPQGPAGASYQEEFETVSKNLKSWAAAFNYTGGLLTSIVYTSGSDTITKTFNRTGGVLTSVVLSGDTPSGIELTKTFNYTLGALTSVAYS